MTRNRKIWGSILWRLLCVFRSMSSTNSLFLLVHKPNTLHLAKILNFLLKKSVRVLMRSSFKTPIVWSQYVNLSSDLDFKYSPFGENTNIRRVSCEGFDALSAWYPPNSLVVGSRRQILSVRPKYYLFRLWEVL